MDQEQTNDTLNISSYGEIRADSLSDKIEMSQANCYSEIILAKRKGEQPLIIVLSLGKHCSSRALLNIDSLEDYTK